MTELIPEYIINKDGGKVSPITSANTVFRENGNRIEDEIDEAIQKSKNAITADNLIQGHGISITKDDNNITISNKAAEHIQLLFLDTDENNPILTNVQPSVNKIILPITPFSAPTGEWIEFLTVNAFDDIKDMEVQFIPNNRFSAKLWLNSSRSRDNIQVRMQVFDTSDNTILASATAKINLLGDETIPIPILFENIHQELRELPLSQIQIVMSIMPSQSGVQIGVISNPSDEISYINITTAAGITESGKDGFSPEIIEAVNTETTYQLDIKTADDEFRTPNLKGGVIAGQSIGVIGTFAKQSMSSKWTYIKFIPTEGQVETIDVDGSWICPKDGIYMISCHLGVSNSVSSSIRYFALQLNATTVMTDSAMIAYVSSSASTALPTINRTIKLAKGDNISAWFNCSAAMTINNTDDSRVSKFSITLDSSIDLTIWDAYETWKSLDSSREEDTFDDWISEKLKQSTVRCSGAMIDSPLSGNYSATPMTPKINNGDTSLVSNNRFIAPISGLYSLSVSSNRTPASGNLSAAIQLNADLYDAVKEISNVYITNNNAFPSISCINYLNKGDFLVYMCTSSVAQSLSSIANTSLKFEFALLGSSETSETININDMVSLKEDNMLEILDNKLYLPKVEVPVTTIVADALDYPIGWQQVTAWTDDVIHTNHGIWLKCNGQEIDSILYPGLINTNAIIKSMYKVTPNMTSNTTPAPYIVSASSTWDANAQPYNAFSGRQDNDWISAPDSFNKTTRIGNAYLTIDMNKPTTIISYVIRSRSVTGGGLFWHPSDWVLQGSDDGNNWIAIDERIGEPQPNTLYSPKSYSLENMSTYRYYRLFITKVASTNGAVGCCVIGELELQNLNTRIINIPINNGQFTYAKAKNNDLTNNELEQQRAMFQWANAELDTEYWTGKHWIDGKKIYGKKINFGFLPNNSETSIPLNITNLDFCVNITGIMSNPNMKVFAQLPFSHSDTNRCIAMFVVDNNLNVATGNDRSAFTLITTLEYTCTDR